MYAQPSIRFEYPYRTNYSYNGLKWVPFDRFKDIKQIGEGGFSKVYSATWINGHYDNPREILNPGPMKVALKRLNESQNMSDEYLNKVLYI